MAPQRLLIAALCVAGSEATGTSMTMQRANPIRKVVTMIQNIVKKVEGEGKAAEELFDKFMCECNKEQTTLEKQISDAETKGSDVAAGLKAGAGQAEQLKAEITQAKSDRAAANDAVASATAIREKEAKAFKSGKAESSANIKAMGAAISAIEAGSGAAFLQTPAAAKLKELVNADDNLGSQEHEDIMDFLQNGEGSEGTGEVVGMLKQLKEDMSKDLGDAEATEADAIKTFNSLVQAKTKEINALQASLEEKMARLGELGVANAELANDGGDTGDSLAKDKQSLADSKVACEKRTKEWEAEKKLRSEELVALADTIDMLNSDEALELFKKALPGASSFMQVSRTASMVRSQALASIHASQKKHHGKSMLKLDFLALALQGKRKGFDQVLTMIDKMIGTLKTEQTEDDDKKAYCNAEFDKAEDEQKALERKVSDAQTAIDDAKESVATLIDEIKAIKAGIAELDGSVAIATAQRQQENAAFKQLVSENAAAKELITMAKKRLNKFYNPSFLQGKAKESAAGVIAMMTTLINDLGKETAVAEAEEKNAQADYEQAMADAKDKRIADAKLVEDKESAKAEADDALQTNVDGKTAAGKELQGVKDYTMMLHADCDWLIKYYDTRKQARADEIDALGKAKDVLNGADFSFLQVASSNLRGVSRH